MKLTGAGRAPRTPEEEAAILAQPLPPQGNLIGFWGVALKTELELAAGDEAEQARIMAEFKQIKTRGEAKAYLLKVFSKMEAARASLQGQQK